VTLQAAADALDALAAGLNPKRADAISGALRLQTLVLQGHADRDLMDAAAGLEAVATGQPLDLNEAGRARAAVLATLVRHFVDRDVNQRATQ
jgi:hypothetical protein